MAKNGAHKNPQAPLLGVKLCCTSIPVEERSDMARVVQEMGGRHYLDLGSNITHLIAGATDTPKYKYVAKVRPDIKVLRREWLEAVRLSWVEGGDTDVIALEEEYKVPTFATLHVCVTGFDTLEQRKAYEKAFNANGAVYHADLSKNVTHLVAATPAGKKYNYACRWGVKVVSPEWVSDSLERGMVLEESLYHPTTPAEERGNGAMDFETVSPSVLGKRQRNDDQQASMTGQGKRTLRRTASAKLGSQNDGIWADIGGTKSTILHNEASDWNDVVKIHVEPRKPESSPKPFIKNNQSKPTQDDGEENIAEDSFVSKGIFQGQKVSVDRFDERKCRILKDHLAANGAIDVHEQSGPALTNDTHNVFSIIPHDLIDLAGSEANSSLGPSTVVTEWWVERCLHRKMWLDPASDMLSRPIPKFPISGFESENICPTGFLGIDLLHFSKLVKLLGAQYDECLNTTTTVLACNASQPNVEKLKYAADHGIKIVSADWIWQSVLQMTRLPTTGYAMPEMSRPGSSRGSVQHTIAGGRESSGTSRDASRPVRRTSSLAPQGKRIGHLELRRSKKPSATPHIGDKEVVLPLSCETGGEYMITSSHDTENVSKIQEQSQEHGSEPLSEIPPEVNSPQKRSRSASSQVSEHQKTSSFRNDESSTDPSVPVDILAVATKRAPLNLTVEVETSTSGRPPSRSLDENIASILAEKKAVASVSNEELASRRRRPLGRAFSSTSSFSVSRASSLDVPARQDTSGCDEQSESKQVEILPSQVISWGPPDPHTQQDKGMRQLGLDGSIETKHGMVTVESVGLVKDIVIGEAVAQRVQRRQRNAKRQ